MEGAYCVGVSDQLTEVFVWHIGA